MKIKIFKNKGIKIITVAAIALFIASSAVINSIMFECKTTQAYGKSNINFTVK